MATSQNGWSVIRSDDIVPLVVRGVSYAPGVRKSLLPLFSDFCHRLAAIEAPHKGWCWGWASRPVRGKSSGYSNHASGTAIDHNAPHHPRGASRYPGFTTGQVKAIHALLERYDGVIRWGGDYRSAPYDSMHFEIDANPAQVRNVMDRLKAPKEELSVADVQRILERLEDVETKVESVFNQVNTKTGTVANEVRALRQELAEVKALVAVRPGQ